MNEGNSELAELASESEQLDRLHDEVRQSRTSITKKIAAVMVRCHIDFRAARSVPGANPGGQADDGTA